MNKLIKKILLVSVFITSSAFSFAQVTPPTNLTASAVFNDVNLSWVNPVTGELYEISYDDGERDAGYLIENNEYMGLRLTMPEDGILQEITLMLKASGGDQELDNIIVCADDGTGLPDLTTVYEEYGVVIIPYDNEEYDWHTFTLTNPTALSINEDFWIIAQWPIDTAFPNAVWLGADNTVPPAENRNYYSEDGQWILFDDKNLMIRAYYSLPTKSHSDNKQKVISRENFSNKETQLSIGDYETSISSNNTKSTNIITKEKDLLSYNIYRDNQLIGNTTEELFYDFDLEIGSYEYYVTAVFDEGESNPSNIVSAEVNNPYVKCDDFDNLVVGEYVAEQLGGLWTTWGETPGGSNDAYVVDDFANSGSNSFFVANAADIVRKLAYEPINEGLYTYSHYMYVPSGNCAYFNIQTNPVPGIGWNVHLYFLDDGTGYFEGLTSGSYTFLQDTWFFVEIIYDFNNNIAKVFFDGVLIEEFDTNDLSIGGVNYWAIDEIGSTPVAYYDDVCFEGYWDAIGIEEIDSSQKIHIYPNPANEVIHLDNVIDADIFLYDISGRLVNFFKSSTAINTIDVSGTEGGAYIIKIVSDDKIESKKVIISK